MLLSQIYAKQYVYPLKGCRRMNNFTPALLREVNQPTNKQQKGRKKKRSKTWDDCYGEINVYKSLDEGARAEHYMDATVPGVCL